MHRRAFILRILEVVGASVTVILTGLAGGSLIGPIVPRRYAWSLWPLGAIPSTLRFKEGWTPVGAATAIPDGKITLVTVMAPVRDAWVTARAPVALYVRRSGLDFTVFDIHCTHLGCGVRWTPSAERFFCPCHGGVYNADGRVIAGPPPFPLYRYATRIENGTLYVGPLQNQGQL